MSKLNAIIVMAVTTAKNFKKNFDKVDNTIDSAYVRNDLTTAQRLMYKEFFYDKFERFTVNATEYIPIEFWLTIEAIETLLTDFSGKIILVAVFNFNGYQYGRTLVPATYDEDGKELTSKTQTGESVYPQHAKAIDLMPNAVFERVHSIMGAGKRMWD